MRKLPLFLCLSCVIASAACGGPEYGIGQGQPAFTPRSAAAQPLIGLALTSVFVARNPAMPASTRADLGYVKLTNTGATAIDFTVLNLSLQATSGASVALTPGNVPTLAAPLQPQRDVALDEAYLQKFAQALGYPQDQVAIVDETFTVQAYLAWGTQALGTTVPELTQRAIASGAISNPGANFVSTAGLFAASTSVYVNAGNPGSLTAP